MAISMGLYILEMGYDVGYKYLYPLVNQHDYGKSMKITMFNG